MIPTITATLRAVSTARFFDTERGYQGEFLAELRKALPALGQRDQLVDEGGLGLRQEDPMQRVQQLLLARGPKQVESLVVYIHDPNHPDRPPDEFWILCKIGAKILNALSPQRFDLCLDRAEILHPD